MDTKAVKRYLEKILWTERRIEYKKEELRRLRANVGIGGMNYEKENIQTTKNQDPMGDKVADIVAVEEEIERLINVRKTVISKIEKLEGRNYELLINRYVLHMDWWSIAEKMDCSRSTITRIHKQALIEFSKIM